MGIKNILNVVEMDSFSFIHAQKSANESIYIGYQKEDGLGFFVTDWNKTDEMKYRLESPLQKTKDITQLWIKPYILNHMVDELMKRLPNFKISWFSSIYNPSYKSEKNIKRPDTKKSLQYKGEDGLKMLLELRQKYGIMPKIIEFSLSPNKKYRIDNRGIITIRKGSLKPLQNTIQKALEEINPWINAFTESDIKTRQRKLTNYSISLKCVRPWNVILKRDMFSNEIKLFEKNVSSKEWGFAPMRNFLNFNEDNTVENYSARYFDKINHTSFRVDYTDKRHSFSIYPHQHKSLSGGMRFVQSIHELLDNNIVAG
ncbi:MAG: hypothetical protein R6U61_09060 [Thermoplasmata archaeon]